MKKLVGLLVSLLMVFGVVSSASASFFENYTGIQEVGEPDSYLFEFDLMFVNGGLGTDVGTTAPGMTLQNDINLEHISYPQLQSAYISITLYDEDNASETTGLTIKAAHDGAVFETTWEWNGKNDGEYKTFTSAITLDGFLYEPYGSITIQAAITGVNHYNDFTITEVGIGGTQVPEPATMLLFGLGLLSLAGVNRRK